MLLRDNLSERTICFLIYFFGVLGPTFALLELPYLWVLPALAFTYLLIKAYFEDSDKITFNEFMRGLYSVIMLLIADYAGIALCAGSSIWIGFFLLFVFMYIFAIIYGPAEIKTSEGN